MRKIKFLVLTLLVLKSSLALSCPACWGKENYKGDDQVQEFLKKRSGSLKGDAAEFNTAAQNQPVCDFRTGNDACKGK